MFVENDIRRGRLFAEAVADRLVRSCAILFAGLKDEDQRTTPVAPLLEQAFSLQPPQANKSHAYHARTRA